MDYYSTLGVPKNASQDDIKKAFRGLAHQYHPDKKGGDEKKFKEVNEAYQVLSDPAKRQQYDQYGQVFNGAGPQGGHGGFSWEDMAQQGGGVQFDFGDLGDMFGDFFGGARGGGEPRKARGRDIAVDLTLDLPDVVFGIKKEVRLYRQQLCVHCSGNGAEPGTPIITCAQCKGSGQVVSARRTILGTIQTAALCPSCEGHGKRPEKPCRECHGKGVAKGEATLEIAVPAGIDSGETLRIKGQGEAGPYNGIPGDLFATVQVRPHPKLTREGNDLCLVTPLTISQAVLGDTITVPTLEGDVELKIPAGTQSGKIFKIPGKGVPYLNKQGRGNLVVTVQVTTPGHLNKEQRELFDRLRKSGL